MNETTRHTGEQLIKIYWEAFKGPDPEAAAISAVAEAARDVLLSQLKAKDDRVAVLEAFVRAFDTWRNGLRLAQETIRGADSTWNEQETCLRLLEARDRVGKVGNSL